MGGSPDTTDPLTLAIAPPPDETPEARDIRLREEAEATRRNDEIEEQLKAEKGELRKKKGIVRVLLLGQAESGKSTTLKNFQMMYGVNVWKTERASWRAVVQLNLIHSVNIILDVLSKHLSKRSPHPSAQGLSSNYLPSPVSPAEQLPFRRGGAIPFGPAPGPGQVSATTSELSPDAPMRFNDTHRALRLRLAPLRRVEADLCARLGIATEDYSSAGAISPLAPPSPLSPEASPTASEKSKEIAVRSWKNALFSNSKLARSMRGGRAGVEGESDDTTDVLVQCRDDINALWDDSAIQQMLKAEEIDLELKPGFFLDSIDRVADHAYEPTDDDVIRARLRTTGVQECQLSPDPMTGFPREDWVIYDVGGSRTQRHAWLPFFEDVTAIIFLAPISCFDEQLEEDRRVNRLEDSFILWNQVVSSKMLKKTSIILFTNKVDLLEQKIDNGVSVKKYLTSYGDRPNTAGDVTKYLLGKFKDSHVRLSPEKRPFYGFPTSVVNTVATQKTLASIRDSVLLNMLKNADMMLE